MTTRILVVDLLSSRLPAHWVAGAVVVNAHRVTDTSGEGFAVRLLRAGSSAAFVRGLSDQPTSFGGFSKVGLADDGMASSSTPWLRVSLKIVQTLSEAQTAAIQPVMRASALPRRLLTRFDGTSSGPV